MKLTPIQRKAHVANILWVWGNGLAFSHYAVDPVFKGHQLGNTVWACKGEAVCLASDETTRFEELTKEMEEELINDPLHVRKIRTIFDKKVNDVLSFIDQLKNTDFSNATNDELLSAYNGIVEAYSSTYAYGEPIAFVSTNFADKLEPIVRDNGGTTEEFHILISPREKSFVQKEHQSMLNLCATGNENGLVDHRIQFEWLPYDYGVTHYTDAHFRTEYSKLRKKDPSVLKDELNKLQSYEPDIKVKQEAIEERLQFDDNHKKLFSLVRDSYYLLDRKKEVFTMLHWYSRGLFDEIRKRLHLTDSQIQFILPDEMADFLQERKKPNTSILDERQAGCILVAKPDGTARLLQGKKAQSIIHKLDESRDSDEITDVRGRIAQPGLSIGRARVILDARDCDQIKHGEILVTLMTSPDFMVAVRKASAIVTDEGGVTCHAAIVSRELKLPCIVGTGNATKIIRTGDRIEVDAEQGVVRKVRSAG